MSESGLAALLTDGKLAPPPPPLWRRVGFGDLVFLVLVLGILQTARGGGMIDDPGIGWHLRNIDAMIQQGGWVYTDPFSLPHQAEQPWRTNQWVGDLILWLADRWAGLNGIAVVTTLFLALIYRCFFGWLRADGLSWPLALGWTLIAAYATATAWVARPNLATIGFIPLIAWLCERYHWGRLAVWRLAWLVPLFALWANCHGGFVAGLATLVAAAGIEAAIGVLSLDAVKRIAARRRAGVLALATGAAFLGTLLNPYGLGLYHWLRTLLGNEYLVTLTMEWKSPDFHDLGAGRYELILLLLPLLLGLSRYRPSPVSLGLAILWLHEALQSRRHIPVFVLIVVPLLAQASQRLPWVQRLRRTLTLSPELQEVLRRPTGPPAFVGTCVIAVILLAVARWGPPLAEHNPRDIPTQALDEVLRLQRASAAGGGAVFHSANWGGYLTWHGWPAFKTWIDDRLEPQGEQHFREYGDLMTAAPGWQDYLRSKNITLVCVPPGTPLVDHLAKSPDWEKVYGDTVAVIYRKRG